MPGRSVSSSRVTTDVLIPRIYMLIRRRTVRPVPLASSAKGEGGRVRLAASGTKSGTRPSVYLTVHYASERARARARAQREATDYFLSPVSM